MARRNNSLPATVFANNSIPQVEMATHPACSYLVEILLHTVVADVFPYRFAVFALAAHLACERSKRSCLEALRTLSWSLFNFFLA